VHTYPVNPLVGVLILAALVFVARKSPRPWAAASAARATTPKAIAAPSLWAALAAVAIASSVGFSVAAAHAHMPACRVLGRTEAEAHAGSLIGGAIVASAAAVVASLIGRARAERRRWWFVVLIVAAAAGAVIAAGVWLTIIFPCATD